MEWVRGPVVGRGSFSTVSLAAVVDGPLLAVKSASAATSSHLQHEELVLRDLKDCPCIISCFGGDVTVESDGQQLYNLLLEYVPRGSLADLLLHGPLSEIVVRKYARSILQGLSLVHSRGYVHCDIKPQNTLVSGDGAVKIADFGLAKKRGERAENSVRGTPLYMSPESILKKEYEPPMDVWSVGCLVAEMATGKPVWGRSRNDDVWGLLMRIGFDDGLPEIPSDMSEVGKDFLRRCFVRDPQSRWTADMLLKHPFVADSKEDGTFDVSSVAQKMLSPRSVFGFSRCDDGESTSLIESCSDSRIAGLATGPPPPESWACEPCGWIKVRGGSGRC